MANVTVVRLADQASGFLTNETASATFLTNIGASTQYLTQSSASTTYASRTNPVFPSDIQVDGQINLLLNQSSPSTYINGFTANGAEFLRVQSGGAIDLDAKSITLSATSAGIEIFGTISHSSGNFNTGGNISTTGRITMTSQPAFRYHGFTLNVNGIQGGTAPLNIGGNLAVYPVGNANYSRFTAPIAGKYIVGFSVLIDQNGGRNEVVLRKNGSTSIDGYSYYAANDFGGGTNQYVTAVNTFILNLAANDYLDIYHAVAGTLWSDLARGDRQFWGYLLG